ncbi:hypothetical protein P7C71_g2589, partial [Lecanoromycetidae sp. Uapishka_2]
MHDPFIDEGDEGPEVASRFAQAYAAYDRFGGNIDQSQQLSQYGQLRKYHSNPYGQQPTYQQQLGYGQAPYNSQPATVTSNTRVPTRLPYQAVRGTQAETALKEYTNMSSQMQKAALKEYTNMSTQMQKATLKEYTNMSTQMQKAFIKAHWNR